MSSLDRISMYDHQVNCSCSVALTTKSVFLTAVLLPLWGLQLNFIFTFMHYIKLTIYKKIKCFQLSSSTKILVARHCSIWCQSDILIFLHFSFLCCRSGFAFVHFELLYLSSLCTMNKSHQKETKWFVAGSVTSALH